MEIVRKEVVELLTSDSKKIKKGDMVVISAYGKSYTGFYKGLTNRNALIIGNFFEGEQDFNIAAKGIDKILIVNLI